MAQLRRILVSSGSPLEPEIGFSRAVRIGNFVAVAGTAPISAEGSTVEIGDLYGQTRRCLEIVRDALASAGCPLDRVVRTRVMLTDVERWREAARAHGEFFGEIKPATTFVQVQGFVDSDWLVEIEADGVLG